VIAIFVVAFLLFVPTITLGHEKKMPIEALAPIED
jgi:hypothetical protein